MDKVAREQAGARWLAAMRSGDIEAAWRETDAMEQDHRSGAARQPHHLFWDGTPFAGRSVLVRCEHGLGDTLQFLRFVPALARQARELHLMVQPPLVNLLRGAPGLGHVHNGWLGPHWPAHEVEVEVMELAYALRATADSLPPPYPHLDRNALGNVLPVAPADPRLRVGLLDEDERSRIECRAVRDHYDEARTLRAVASAVRQRIGDGDARVLWLLPPSLAHERKDWPPGWTAEVRGDDADTSEQRLDALYAADDAVAELRRLQEELPAGTLQRVGEWLAEPAFQHLRGEWRVIAGEKKAWSVAPYPVVLVTVDAVVRAGGRVLLIRRGRSPGRGLWALPGGFLDPRETVLRSALRELVEETGLPLTTAQMQQCLRAVRVFDHPARSQRGRIVTHAHFFDLGDAPAPPVQGDDDAAVAQWVPVAELGPMEARFHDDHFHILDEFLGLTGDP